MALQHTPKTDWTPNDGVTSTDINEIGENLQSLEDTKIEKISSPVAGNLVTQTVGGEIQDSGRYLDQDLKTTDNVEFNDLTISAINNSGGMLGREYSPGETTEAAVYTFLSPLIPSNTLKCTGVARLTGENWNVIGIRRKDASTLTFIGTRTEAGPPIRVVVTERDVRKDNVGGFNILYVIY